MIDFDDMLCRAYELLKSDKKLLESWRNRFKYIMIDEFQDINRVQYENVRLLAAPANNLFAVGDDDQSIYRFRGSRPEFLLNFPKDFPGTKSVALSVNYRSTDAIISFANRIISGNKARYAKEITGTARKGDLPVLLRAADQNDEAMKIGERIRTLIKNGANADEIAVAFRLNMQSRAFADAFLHLNIPFRSRDEMPVIYEHWVAEDIFAYMRASLHLTKSRSGAKNSSSAAHDADTTRIINKPYRFISKAFLEKAKKADRHILSVYARDKSLNIAQKTRLEELESHLRTLAKKNSHEAIRYIRRQIGYNAHIAEHCAFRKLDPAGLNELLNELQDAAKAHKHMNDFLAHAQAVIDAKKENAPTGACVTLTTLHSAKGLEFERVFIAGVIEDVLPHVRSQSVEEIEEERRLLYVGITRAKNELFLSIPKTRYDKITEPSRFLHGITEGDKHEKIL
jgi:DNA helicase-2/ATP-dependent DNA helicase PcrA